MTEFERIERTLDLIMRELDLTRVELTAVSVAMARTQQGLDDLLRMLRKQNAEKA